MPPVSQKPMPLVVQLTPAARGAVATLVVDGPGAVELVEGLFAANSGRPLRAASSDRIVAGRIRADARSGEPVVVRRVAADRVELHCHGGPAAVGRLERALADRGARSVPWSDWLASELEDPLQADACRALAEARTERTARILLDQYHGALGRAWEAIRAAVLGGDAGAARATIDALRSRAALGLHLVRPWRVVLAGAVNVGKSSLLNALLGFERVIVDPAPGTTRDAVAAQTAIDGWPVELCDTAGLRQGADVVERAGVERAAARLAEADLVVWVLDATRPEESWEARPPVMERPPIVVWNKCDLAEPSPRPQIFSQTERREASESGPHPQPLSQISQRERGDVFEQPFSTVATMGMGVEALLGEIARRLVPKPPEPGQAVPFTAAQVQCLDQASAAIDVGRMDEALRVLDEGPKT